MAKTGLVHFYKECLRRAFRGKAAKVETITGLLSLVAVPVGLWLWPNEGGAMNWAPLIFFLSLFLASFLFGFELAPYHMLREVEHDNAKLKDKLDNRERRQGAIARLWQRRADGVDLRNQIVKPGDDKEWIKKYEQWREQVLTDAKLVSANLEAWLRTLDRVRPPPHLSSSASDAHGLHRNNMSEILLRLQEFLQAEMLNKDIDQAGN